MRSAAAVLMAVAGSAQAHPAAATHVHGLGMEHAVLFAVVFLLLVFAIKK